MLHIPKHVAIIMDGNRRWLNKLKLPDLSRSYRGLKKRIEPIIDCAIDMGITHLTFWAFSTEKLVSTSREVRFLLVYSG